MTSDRADSEEAIIGAFWAPLAAGFPGALDLKDDCAVLTPEPGTDIVVTTDAVIAGVHFFPDEDPAAIAWKALAVNVSDLVAKGAAPRAYLMTLALPEAPERRWLAAFSEGLRAAQETFGCALVGGDTDRTPGPLSVSITALGVVPAGRMVRRAGVRPGDAVYVSGTIGDATLGLKLRCDPSLAARWQLDAAAAASLGARYARPTPPLALAPALLACASGAMDVSDGLVKDFARMCHAAGVGGAIEAERIPLSAAARTVLARGGATLADLITGGEDYEVLAGIAPERAAEFEHLAAAAGTPVVQIGSIGDIASGVRVIDAGGGTMTFVTPGWDHFDERGRRSGDGT